MVVMNVGVGRKHCHSICAVKAETIVTPQSRGSEAKHEKDSFSPWAKIMSTVLFQPKVGFTTKENGNNSLVELSFQGGPRPKQQTKIVLTERQQS